MSFSVTVCFIFSKSLFNWSLVFFSFFRWSSNLLIRLLSSLVSFECLEVSSFTVLSNSIFFDFLWSAISFCCFWALSSFILSFSLVKEEHCNFKLSTSSFKILSFSSTNSIVFLFSSSAVLSFCSRSAERLCSLLIEWHRCLICFSNSEFLSPSSTFLFSSSWLLCLINDLNESISSLRLSWSEPNFFSSWAILSVRAKIWASFSLISEIWLSTSFFNLLHSLLLSLQLVFKPALSFFRVSIFSCRSSNSSPSIFDFLQWEDELVGSSFSWRYGNCTFVVANNESSVFKKMLIWFPVGSNMCSIILLELSVLNILHWL